MHRGFCSRSIAIGGVCLLVTMAGALIEPADAQAQQLNGFATGSSADEFYPLWAKPYMSSGFNAGSNIANGSSQPLYIARFGSGVAGIFLQSNGRDDGAGASGTFGNFSGPLFASPTTLRQDLFGVNLGNPAWRTSIFGSYKSDATLFNGLYATASFGVAGIRTNPSGFSGLTNFSAGNDVRLTVGAGLGLQLTPQITIEGSFSWTQMPPSTFR